MKKTLSTALLAMACAANMNPAAAQDFSSKPIRIVVPLSPGGGSDILARELGARLAIRLKTTVVIENKTGAGGSIGADAVAKSAPDGHTLLVTPTHLAIYPALQKKLPYDPRKDFTPLALLATTAAVIVVRADSPYQSLPQLLDDARKNPGKLSFGSTGMGGSTHLTGELLNMRAGVNMVHVPYKGTSPALTDLLGGHLPVHIDVVIGVLEQHRAGKLRVLAVSSLKRAALLPDVPTVAEATGIKDFNAIGWFAAFAPANMPEAIRTTLSSAIHAELMSQGMKQRIAALGAEPEDMTQQEFSSFFTQEMDKWQKVVTTANIKME